MKSGESNEQVVAQPAVGPQNPMMPLLHVVALLPLVQTPPELVPKLDEVRLAVGTTQLAPVGSREGVLDQLTADSWHVEIFKERIAVKGTADQAPRLVPTTSPSLRCLAISGDVAWLADYEAKVPILLRLQLEQGEWLPEWTLDDKTLRLPPQEGLESHITTVLPYAGMLYIVRRDELRDGPYIAGTRAIVIARLNATTGKAIWAKREEREVPSRAERPPGVPMDPMLAVPGAEWPIELQFFEEGLLACALGSQALMLLELDSGKPLWTIDRLWEYQRGFLGPSTWRHFVGRFGLHEGFMDEEQQQLLDERQRTFRESHVGAFVAGPFIVREQEHSEEYPRPRLLVITSIAPRDPYSRQLAQHCVYEIDSFHKPCAMAPLPRNAFGWAASVDGDQLTLACTQGAWSRFSTTLNGWENGSHDCITGMLWYRMHEPVARSAWMVCGPVRDAADMNPDLGVRIAGGGWIASKDEALFHFPLWFIDPRSGDAREAELLVPFSGRMTPPDSASQRRGKSFETGGWRGLGLTTIWLKNGQLSFWLANASQTWRVDFDATGLAALR